MSAGPSPGECDRRAGRSAGKMIYITDRQAW